MRWRPFNGYFKPALIVGLAALLLASACGDGASKAEPSRAKERPLTGEEAGRLTEALFNNHEKGGAAFSLVAQLNDRTELRMSGVTNWTTGTGAADFSSTNPGYVGVSKVAWAGQTVMVQTPALVSLGIAQRLPEWTAHKNDSAQVIDGFVAMIMKLAVSQRDNPLLIRQKPGSAYLRSDAVSGKKVDVMRYGKSARYWLTAGGVTLVRFDASGTARAAQIIIDLSELGPKEFQIPNPQRLPDSTELGQLYLQALATPP